MKLLTYNTLFAGFDGTDNRRQKLQHEVIREISPDVLLIQEAKNFERDGFKLLFETEAALGLRGLLGIAPHTGQNTAVFFKPEILPVSFEVDSVHFHHAASVARLKLPGLDQPVVFVSVHLAPNSPHARWREATYLINYAASDGFALVAGDFNSVSSNDPEPQGWENLPAHFRSRYLLPGSSTADRQTLDVLYSAGFVDIAHRLGKNGESTVPGTAFKSAEFIPFRCDHVLASPKLADRAVGYEVIKDARTGEASDHYPMAVEFTI
ncbi:MAG: endonuclease/exonuclease/phosphatase family protein [Terrimicrobiaceae bacterium]|nr:endonuclease/exonuclease/phosphatase family protein [Terrimicrobiaceae bacterium]